MNIVKVKIKMLGKIQPPTYSHGPEEDAGLDLRAAHDLILIPGQVAAVPCGFQIEIPSGYQGEIRTRSGLALKGIVVNNSPGTVDPGYRGEVRAIILNQTTEAFKIEEGDRIAQMLIVPYVGIEWEEVDELEVTERGSSGFGSTGMK